MKKAFCITDSFLLKAFSTQKGKTLCGLIFSSVGKELIMEKNEPEPIRNNSINSDETKFINSHNVHEKSYYLENLKKHKMKMMIYLFAISSSPHRDKIFREEKL